MKLDGRRSSNNVEDRRGSGRGRTIAGIGGIGGLIIAALFVWLSGGTLYRSSLKEAPSFASSDEIRSEYQPTPQEEAYADFAKKIPAGTEDVWTEEFKRWDSHIEAENGAIHWICRIRLRAGFFSSRRFLLLWQTKPFTSTYLFLTRWTSK